MTAVTYALPNATGSVLGGIKVGTGLSASSGVLSLSGTSTVVSSFTPTLTGSSGTATALTINPTVNQSGTAAYTALLVNSIESALGSSSHYLILGQVNSSNVFTVDNAGNIATTGSFPATSLSGTLSDSRLSSNVPFKATNNIFTCAISSISSGSASFFSITPSVQQSGTAGYTSLLINTTETSTGSGTKLLVDLQVAASSKFKVDDTGIVTAVSSVIGSNFSPTGLTGATAASRYVGATASGAPVSGTFAVGDHIIDQTGKILICTVAGTPGTWVNVTNTLTSTSGYLGSDVTLTNANQFYDAVSISLTAGTWLIVGACTGQTTATSDSLSVKLWDGTTVTSSNAGAQIVNAAGLPISIPISGIVSPSITTTYKISAATTTGGNKILAALTYNGVGNNATYLNAIKIA